MFNWFRRQTGTPSQPEEQKQTPEQAPPEAQPTDTESTKEEPSLTQDEYLNWAKTAFANIQKRKAQQAQAPSESTETVVEGETVTVESAAKTTAPIATSSTPTVEIPEIEAAAPEPETSAPSPAPAWMRKSDRLEILKETAIETPAPKAKQEPVAPFVAPTETADLPFDEEFVWSARVLAAQGRKPEDISSEEISWLKRLRQGLGKTRRSLVNQLKAIVGQGPLNRDAVMEIEALLLQADVGLEATDYIISTLQNRLREEALPPEDAIEYLKTILRDILDRPLKNLGDPAFAPEKDTLNIWLLTGVNGVGKTTTIGKLAHLAQKSGYSCLIVAADTFRAAAVEQVKVWGERSGTSVIANPGKNTDPAAVVYDGIAAAQSRNIDLLLVDTAGRLQNKKNLMEELAKIRRIIDKKAADAKVESLLVLDATLGQNGLRQAQVFAEVAKLSGVVLTKLDGTAKGGVALAVAQQLNLPIRFIGAGEGIEDLRPFSSYEFVEALLNG
ncbi:MAG: signal recognition particle-docking protein FtsY [Hydrococcus sp. C42_A2020_068]|uniref:signal recognition particle-docking protein FtsY n=1 Tax=Pleurocapsa sp. PCC 7327 TaxID=118163 RepID=UPI00029FBD25|nr:signal recognition particle-docking protein FtsY [Pleurocapsa sp. PCC 7327]AFY77815.1 signal recognition particle-docking protein FtsY [Pleurocapsa sp. PCC 7327]MBF2021473.1 signal recognition particle-docking protein FtsY [Hydrococcus sp. C42_A2020_068]